MLGHLLTQIYEKKGMRSVIPHCAKNDTHAPMPSGPVAMFKFVHLSVHICLQFKYCCWHMIKGKRVSYRLLASSARIYERPT